MRTEVLIDVKTVLGEGPLWDVEEQRLYFIDSFGCNVFRCTADGREVRAWDVPAKIKLDGFAQTGRRSAARARQRLPLLDLSLASRADSESRLYCEGRHAAFLAEMAVEVGDISVANLEADVSDRAPRVRQEFASAADAQFSRIVDEIGAAGVLLKKREKADCVIPAIAAASDIPNLPREIVDDI